MKNIFPPNTQIYPQSYIFSKINSGKTKFNKTKNLDSPEIYDEISESQEEEIFQKELTNIKPLNNSDFENKQKLLSQNPKFQKLKSKCEEDKNLHHQYLENHKEFISENSELYVKINRIFQKVAKASGRENLHLNIVSDGETVNASHRTFTTEIYIYEDFLIELQSYLENKNPSKDLTEDMIAAVIGHEIRHSHQDFSDYLKEEKVINFEYVTKSKQKKREYDADSFGLQYAARAGFNPHGMRDVLIWLKEISGDDVLSKSFTIVGAHPHSDDRLKHVSGILLGDDYAEGQDRIKQKKLDYKFDTKFTGENLQKRSVQKVLADNFTISDLQRAYIELKGCRYKDKPTSKNKILNSGETILKDLKRTISTRMDHFPDLKRDINWKSKLKKLFPESSDELLELLFQYHFSGLDEFKIKKDSTFEEILENIPQNILNLSDESLDDFLEHITIISGAKHINQFDSINFILAEKLKRNNQDIFEIFNFFNKNQKKLQIIENKQKSFRFDLALNKFLEFLAPQLPLQELLDLVYQNEALLRDELPSLLLLRKDYQNLSYQGKFKIIDEIISHFHFVDNKIIISLLNQHQEDISKLNKKDLVDFYVSEIYSRADSDIKFNIFKKIEINSKKELFYILDKFENLDNKDYFLPIWDAFVKSIENFKDELSSKDFSTIQNFFLLSKQNCPEKIGGVRVFGCFAWLKETGRDIIKNGSLNYYTKTGKISLSEVKLLQKYVKDRSSGFLNDFTPENQETLGEIIAGFGDRDISSGKPILTKEVYHKPKNLNLEVDPSKYINLYKNQDFHDLNTSISVAFGNQKTDLFLEYIKSEDYRIKDLNEFSEKINFYKKTFGESEQKNDLIRNEAYKHFITLVTSISGLNYQKENVNIYGFTGEEFYKERDPENFKIYTKFNFDWNNLSQNIEKNKFLEIKKIILFYLETQFIEPEIRRELQIFLLKTEKKFFPEIFINVFKFTDFLKKVLPDFSVFRDEILEKFIQENNITQEDIAILSLYYSKNGLTEDSDDSTFAGERAMAMLGISSLSAEKKSQWLKFLFYRDVNDLPDDLKVLGINNKWRFESFHQGFLKLSPKERKSFLDNYLIGENGVLITPENFEKKDLNKNLQDFQNLMYEDTLISKKKFKAFLLKDIFEAEQYNTFTHYSKKYLISSDASNSSHLEVGNIKHVFLNISEKEMKFHIDKIEKIKGKNFQLILFIRKEKEVENPDFLKIKKYEERMKIYEKILQQEVDFFYNIADFHYTQERYDELVQSAQKEIQKSIESLDQKKINLLPIFKYYDNFFGNEYAQTFSEKGEIYKSKSKLNILKNPKKQKSLKEFTAFHNFIYDFVERVLEGADEEVQKLLGDALITLFSHYPDHRKLDVFNALLDISQDKKNDTIPLKIMKIFAACKPLGVKIGQYLSEKPEIIKDPEIRKALSQLKNNVPSFPIQTIFDITAEKGLKIKSIGKLKGSASVKQVNEIKIEGISDDLVIKVRRPGILRKLQEDFQVALELQKMFKEKGFNIPNFLPEIRDGIKTELDFLEEAENQKKLKEILSESDSENFNFTTSDVFCAYENFSIEKNASGECLADLKNISPEIKKAIIKSFTAQVEAGFFHADLHSGNIFIDIKKSEITFIDTGLMGKISPEKGKNYIQWMNAVLEKDFEKIKKILPNLMKNKKISHLKSLEMIKIISQKGSHQEKADKITNLLKGHLDKDFLIFLKGYASIGEYL